MTDLRKPVSVAFPEDVEAAEQICQENPLADKIIEINARKEDVPKGEYIRYAAGQTVSATCSELGLIEDRTGGESIEVTIPWKHTPD